MKNSAAAIAAEEAAEKASRLAKAKAARDKEIARKEKLRKDESERIEARRLAEAERTEARRLHWLRARDQSIKVIDDEILILNSELSKLKHRNEILVKQLNELANEHAK